MAETYEKDLYNTFDKNLYRIRDEDDPLSDDLGIKPTEVSNISETQISNIINNTSSIVTNIISQEGGVGGSTTATFVVGPRTNSDSDTYDYETDGVADQVQVAAAINALPADGGMIVLREGTYNFSDSVQENTQGSFTIKGMGKGTIITCSNTGNPAFDFNGSDIDIYGIHFLNCEEGCIDMDNRSGNINNCYFTNWGLSGSGSAILGPFGTVSNCYFVTTETNLKCIDGAQYITNNIFELPNSYATEVVTTVEGNISGNSFFFGDSAASSSICIYGDVDTVASNNIISYGSSTDPASIAIETGMVYNNWIANSGIAVLIVNDHEVVSGNVINRSFGTAIKIFADQTNCVVTNNTIHDAGIATDNTYFGIHLDDNVNHCVVMGNTITSTHANDTNTGILEDLGGDYNNISHNIVTGCQTAQITTVGANSVVQDNITA